MQVCLSTHDLLLPPDIKGLNQPIEIDELTKLANQSN